VSFVVDKVTLEKVFSEYFGFPYQFSFHQPLHTSSSSSGAGTIGQIVADAPTGISLTQPDGKTKKDTGLGPSSRIRSHTDNEWHGLDSAGYTQSSGGSSEHVDESPMFINDGGFPPSKANISFPRRTVLTEFLRIGQDSLRKIDKRQRGKAA
jgi:hypothetical protein